LGQNIVEKITQKYLYQPDNGYIVRAGDFVNIQPSFVMTHDNSYAVIQKFLKYENQTIHNSKQLVFTLDHDIQNQSEENLTKYKDIEEFAKKFRIDFYPAGRGIGHQIMCEEAYALPNTFVVASDSHSNMYGALGCLGTPITRTDALSIWKRGFTWWQVPKVVKINLKGRMPDGLSGKDLIVELCGQINQDEVLNTAIEFSGDGVRDLSIEDRMSISNMTTEWGALVGIFPFDEVTKRWYEKNLKYYGENERLNKEYLSLLSGIQDDSDAQYATTINIDLTTLRPSVSGPNSVKISTAITEIEQQKIKIDKAYLVSCVNSRIEDIEAAANILKNKKIASHVKFYLAAASNRVQNEAEQKGYWDTLIEAGATILPPGCGPCIGLGAGILEPGEVGISATNRNFSGRMGSREALAYLASPTIVAYSALNGYISGPGQYPKTEFDYSIQTNTGTIKANKNEILDKFYKSLNSNAVFIPSNNLNTDGIYPGKYTYEELSNSEQAKVVMENYDDQFIKIAQNSEILIAGSNFGTGSSREQAATALKHFGIKIVITESFSETYKRNAINNGLIVAESEELVQYLFEREFSELTNELPYEVRIDFENSSIHYDNSVFSMSPINKVAQEIIIRGGIYQFLE
jgi:homoaconitate hydratase